MIEDALTDLIAANGGQWRGTSESLMAILGAVFGEITPEKLEAELKKCRSVLVEKDKAAKSRLLTLRINSPADSSTCQDRPDNLPDNLSDSFSLQVGNIWGKSNRIDDLVQVYYEQKTVFPTAEEIETTLIQEAERFLGIIRQPGEVVEIRGLRHGRKGSVSGWFQDMALAAKKAVKASPSLKGTYFTLNPVEWESTNKIGPVQQNTADKDILRRSWLLIDIEGRREKAAEQNAADSEVVAAIELATIIRAETKGAAPLVLCSGNGCHLLYRIDIPNDQASAELVKRALYGLAAKYNSAGAEIDVKVANASRISKLPGTYTGKGENTEDRPCRWARVLDWSQEGVLPVSVLEEWGKLYQAPRQESPSAVSDVSPDDVWKSKVDPVERASKYLEQRKPAIEGQGGDAWTFDTCCLLTVEFLLTEGEALEALRDWNGRCQPPWSPEELSDKLANARKYGKGQPGRLLNEKPTKKITEIPHADTLNDLPMTDLGNAEALIKLYGQRLRWYASGGYWLWWNGRHWEKDIGGKALSWANKTARARRQAAAALEDEDQRKKLVAYCYQSENSSRRDSMLSQFKAYMNHVVQSHQLDANPWLLNCLNGTLDLKTGELHRHEQKNYITRLVQCEYNRDAECPLWLKYLDRVMGGERELIEYIQRAVGYTLTGNTSEHAVFICHGHGRNGKSLFLKILGQLLGDYARTAQSKTFQDTGQHEAISNSLARLDGSRLCVVSETSANYKLDEAGVKSLSGQDTVTARFLHQEFFEFKPQFKIWIASNYRPLVSGADLGIWRRLKLIPWNVTISPQEDDTGLFDKLCDELPGILNWAVKGCLQWQETRLKEPAIVSKAIDEYRHEQDTLSQFLSDRCVIVGGDRSIDLADLYTAYLDWAKAEGHRVTMHKQTISKKLKEKGFEHYITSRSKRPHFRGILLRSDDPFCRAGFDAENAIAELERDLKKNDDDGLLDIF